MNKPKVIVKRLLGRRIAKIVASILRRIRTTPKDVLKLIKEFYNPIKVSFIVVGAQKSGTTALWHFLSQHPELSLSTTKETDFFSTDKFWINGENYDLYKKFFKPYFKKLKYGEASPSYMLKHEHVAPRIAKYNPSIKLIFIMKNPIERAFSQYKMHVKRYNLNLSFHQCLKIALNQKHEDIIIDNGNPVTLNGSIETLKSYITFGKYVEQIKTFKKYFRQDQMLFLLTEDLSNNHEETMKKIYNFLDISYVNINQEIIHSNKISSTTIGKIEAEILLTEFSNEIDELEKLLDKDLSHWKNTYYAQNTELIQQ